MFNALNPFRPDTDPAGRELSFLSHGQARWTVRAERDMFRPGLEGERETRAMLTPANDREPFVPVFPPVAVRAVVNAYAVALAQTANRRQLIADARGEQD